MNNYSDFILLAILVVLVYKKPEYLNSIYNNKFYLLILIFLNGYIAKKYGIISGIIMALIVVILIDSKETFCNNIKNDEEEHKLNVRTWRPANFSSPCQTDNDRILKTTSELTTLNATK